MQRFLAWLFLFAALPFPAQTDLTPPATLGELRQRLAARLAEPRFANAEWGIKIVSLDTGKTVFEHNAGKLLSPASNTKLFTCALALERLGPDVRLKTSLLATNRPDATGVLHSDLIVYGRGDPTYTAEYGHGDARRSLAPLVAALTNAGVRTIEGDLIGDDSSLPGGPAGSGWDWDDPQHAYGAQISALSINDNVLRVLVRPATNAGQEAELTLDPPTSFVRLVNQTQTVNSNVTLPVSAYRPAGGNLTQINGQVQLGGPVSTNIITVHNPAGLFVAWFREALEQAGVRVVGSDRTIGWRDRQGQAPSTNVWKDLGSVESPAIRELVRDTLKNSRNLNAGLLLACAGVHQSSSNTLDSAETRGARELGLFLEKAGLNRREFFFNEGAGLSRENLVTANAITQLLEFMSKHSSADAFTNALPVAGVDGTLAKRMIGTAAEKRVTAKTGALRWAHTLSGYATTTAGENLAFALLLNRYQELSADAPARQELDAIAAWLAGLTQHSRDWNQP